MNYTEFKNYRQNEINKLPLGFAYGNDQFNDMMKKWGLNADKESDLKQICRVYSGCYIQKKDKELLHSTLDRLSEEESELFKNQEFLVEALMCEMSNHEYGYTHDIEDTLNALGFELEDLQSNQLLASAVEIAKKKYFGKCGE